MDIQLELLKALAAQQDEYVVVREDVIILKNDCPSNGGTYYANTPEGIEEAIEQLTYEVLNPLDDK